MKHVDQVRLEFEQPDAYLNGSKSNIRVRAETVQSLIGARQYKRILEIGCGDASISLPLLHVENRLTLIDLSSTMLSRARSKVRPELIQNVEFLNDDFLCAPPTGSYDLIICIGVLAHVASPTAFVQKIANTLEPEGTAVVQVTDGGHFVTRAVQTFNKLCGSATSPYPLTQLGAGEVVELFMRQGLQPVDSYRYTQPHGLGRLLSGESLYRLTRFMYGSHPRGRNAGVGNEILFRFDAPASKAALSDAQRSPYKESGFGR